MPRREGRLTAEISLGHDTADLSIRSVKVYLLMNDRASLLSETNHGLFVSERSVSDSRVEPEEYSTYTACRERSSTRRLDRSPDDPR